MQNLGLYLAYMAVSAGLLAAGVVLYTLITPYRELSLIRAGNGAASYSLGGTVIGLAVALASAATHSVSLLDMAMWGGVALVAQLLAFVAVSALLSGFRDGIEADKTSYGITLGGVSIAVGILNAGSLTW